MSSDFENEDVNFGVSASESLEQDERMYVSEGHILPLGG